MNALGIFVAKVFTSSELSERRRLLQDNLDRLDESAVQALDEVVAEVLKALQLANEPRFRPVLEIKRTMCLAEMTSALGAAGRHLQARSMAAHCLRSFKRAFVTLGQLDLPDDENADSLLTLLLADAGELRRVGLEQEAWQAYWIADRVCAAQDSCDDDQPNHVEQLLVAALFLESVGMRARARRAMEVTRRELGNDRRFHEALRLAKSVSQPAGHELPAPDMYDGSTMATALRFASLRVGVECVRQTRCRRCRGEMNFERLGLVGGSGGGLFDAYKLTCKQSSAHPTIDIYSDATSHPGMKLVAAVAAGIGDAAKWPAERQATRRPGPDLKELFTAYEETQRLLVEYDRTKDPGLLPKIRAIQPRCQAAADAWLAHLDMADQDHPLRTVFLVGLSMTYRMLAGTHMYLEEFDTAKEIYESARDIGRETGQVAEVVQPLNNLGIIMMELGKPAEAVAYYKEALALLEEGNEFGAKLRQNLRAAEAEMRRGR